MTTIVPRRRLVPHNAFEIHEDVPHSADTDMNEEEVEEDEGEEAEQEEGDDQESTYSESSEEAVVDTNIVHDMEKLANAFPGFRHRYRLIKRIGEGVLA